MVVHMNKDVRRDHHVDKYKFVFCGVLQYEIIPLPSPKSRIAQSVYYYQAMLWTRYNALVTRVLRTFLVYTITPPLLCEAAQFLESLKDATDMGIVARAAKKGRLSAV